MKYLNRALAVTLVLAIVANLALAQSTLERQVPIASLAIVLPQSALMPPPAHMPPVIVRQSVGYPLPKNKPLAPKV